MCTYVYMYACTLVYHEDLFQCLRPPPLLNPIKPDIHPFQ